MLAEPDFFSRLCGIEIALLRWAAYAHCATESHCALLEMCDSKAKMATVVEIQSYWRAASNLLRTAGCS